MKRFIINPNQSTEAIVAFVHGVVYGDDDPEAVLSETLLREHGTHNQKDHAGKGGGRSVAPKDQTPAEQEAVAAWTGTAHAAPGGQVVIVDFHNRIQDALAGKRRDPDITPERWEQARRQGETLMQMAADSPPSTETLVRGMATGPDAHARWASHKPGDSVTMTLNSYSADESVARRYSTGELRAGPPATTLPVLVRVEPGARALNMDEARGQYAGSWEKERLAAGDFTVVSVSMEGPVSRHDLPTLTVTMRQTAPARTAQDVRLGEARLMEHPGHRTGSNQSVHGRKPLGASDIAKIKAGKRPATGAERAAARTSLAAAKAAEPAVTADLKRLEKMTGGKLEGLQHRLKTEDSLARKVAGDVDEKGLTPDASAGQIYDSLRYTFTSPAASYTTTANATAQAMESAGYTLERRKNTWGEGDNYQGVNEIWSSPSGQKFELQHHTPQSLAIKDPSHALFEIQRATPSMRQRERLQGEIADLWAPLNDHPPVGSMTIPDQP